MGSCASGAGLRASGDGAVLLTGSGAVGGALRGPASSAGPPGGAGRSGAAGRCPPWGGARRTRGDLRAADGGALIP